VALEGLPRLAPGLRHGPPLAGVGKFICVGLNYTDHAAESEITAVGALPLWLTVNGERCQNGNTDRMIFDVPALVSYLSQFMTLMPETSSAPEHPRASGSAASRRGT
jgi:2-keto-4-pentenoate hydratase/2-oxohepta-3-ene-1,7-dioic acid hydratase in catechol pathway